MTGGPGTSPLGVGLVGASPGRSWAARAHLPALAHLPEADLVAVATTRASSARETAAAYGVPHAFTRAEDLVEHPDVDLVVVCVKVPDHARVVRAALAAGKHVLCEWPLGVDQAEAVDLARRADAAGVVHAVGLQGHLAPGARFVRDQLRDGAIGRLRAVSVTFGAAGALGGQRVPADMAWAADRRAGVHLLSVSTAHILATLEVFAGPVERVDTLALNTVAEATVDPSGERLAVDIPDQVALHGRLGGGALLAVTVQGGTPPAAAGCALRLVGTAGALVIEPAVAGGSLQMVDWRIRHATLDGPLQERPVPPRYRTIPAAVPAGPPANVAGLYREVADAVATGRAAEPSFHAAVRLHGLVEPRFAGRLTQTDVP